MKVSFEPYEEVSFKSHLFYKSAEKFAQVIASASPEGVHTQVRLFWANGIMFRFFNYRPSETLSKELLERRLPFDHIEFAPMPTYRPRLRVDERPLVNIFILDVTGHTIFDPFTEWLQNNLLKAS
jgi:hypothetical protein